MILDKKVTIYKLTPDQTDADKEGYTLFKSNVTINIQPSTPDWTALGDGRFGKTWIGFTTTSGISETMKVIVTYPTTVSGRKYFVKGVEHWHNPPIPATHYRLLLVEPNE